MSTIQKFFILHHSENDGDRIYAIEPDTKKFIHLAELTPDEIMASKNTIFFNPIRKVSDQICKGINKLYIEKSFRMKNYHLLACVNIQQEVGTIQNVGFLQAYPLHPNELYVHVICSESGYGGKILKHFMEYVKQNQSEIQMISLSALLGVVGFYLKNGFTLRNTCSVPAIQIKNENLAQLRKNVEIFNPHYRRPNIGTLKQFRAPISSDVLYKLYNENLFSDSCDPGLSYPEFLQSTCYAEGVHMVYCFSENPVVPSFKGALPNVPVIVKPNKVTAKNNKFRNITVKNNNNSFGNSFNSLGVPPFPQEKLQQLEQNYRNSLKHGPTRTTRKLRYKYRPSSTNEEK